MANFSVHKYKLFVPFDSNLDCLRESILVFKKALYWSRDTRMNHNTVIFVTAVY